ncbi:acyl-coenzyme A thioesterase 9, mitochondrial [Pundamilia nyererei]|uniref:Acyl-coenzyme A thioesterase 9, mitochondrial n=1 Tax=Pundamilia nyererei TaxID=303518 RepID=A0A9Y6SQH9_9CICH|nr:PREDICTED: acyl-coenzyme A thioesterase 9, mitochondrial [Pundamilia nyererei]
MLSAASSRSGRSCVPPRKLHRHQPVFLSSRENCDSSSFLSLFSAHTLRLDPRGLGSVIPVKMLSQRFLLLRSAASFTRRSFCTGGALKQGKQGKAPDMIEGNPQFHVSNVRNRLREIVGASTNWSDHQQAMAERVSLSSMLAKSQNELPAKRMKDSYLEVHLPLGSEPQLREKYLTHHNTVRFGRILEDLDSLAGTQQIRWAAFVNPLTPEGPEEERLLQEGEANKSRRVELSTASLLKVAPTQEERTVVHGLFLNTLDTNTVSFRSRILPPNSVWMEDAKLKGLEICHPQERNIFNRIFGGFLMRKAYELGWANACSYGGCRPSLVAVDDILFQKPVEIGSLLMLSSQVCYTQGTYVQVRVHSEVFDPLTRQHNTTNIFHFTFTSDRDVPNIMPKTYGESMLYLDGKRHFDQTVAC